MRPDRRPAGREVVGEGPAAAWSERDMIPLMVDGKLEQQYPPHNLDTRRGESTRGDGPFEPGVLADVSLCLHRGEILGVAGLLGRGGRNWLGPCSDSIRWPPAGSFLQGRAVSRGGVQERLDAAWDS